jgi:hypothetical protein
VGLTLDPIAYKNYRYFFLDEISKHPLRFVDFLDNETLLFQNSHNVCLTGLKFSYEDDENKRIWPQLKPFKEIINNVIHCCKKVFAIDREKNHVYYKSTPDKSKIGRCELTKNESYYFADDLPGVTSTPTELLDYNQGVSKDDSKDEKNQEKVLNSAAVCLKTYKIYILTATIDSA